MDKIFVVHPLYYEHLYNYNRTFYLFSELELFEHLRTQDKLGFASGFVGKNKYTGTLWDFNYLNIYSARIGIV